MRAYINQNGVQGERRTIRRYYKSLTFTNNETFLVPNETNQITVDCVAAQGYGNGKGGRVVCVLNVTPSETLFLTVGKSRSEPLNTTYNASAIAKISNTYENRVVVAGGGGNNSSRGSSGGAGGGLTGAAGSPGYRGDSGGRGGTQIAGGAGGVGQPVSVGHYHNGIAGSFGVGASGQSCGYCGQMGAGGDGWYGGGSGAGDWNQNGGYAAGGGGGSSYTDPTICTRVEHTQGYRAGNGYISLTYEVAKGESYDYYVDEGFTAIVRDR